ncbi:LacI family DNA-binding transcriptional regulator [Rathayibacter caricis]|uniref:LacI family DNA-binding transcriptional regulator n=1 Tax=Rathayibacter caricis TaxID=110936 RepID=UPI0024369840|nr:LacI family DNA-binding transcriptional regulator [Rathayibacter caricis]
MTLDGSARKVTLLDVAKAANVSLSTASKVMNGRAGVGDGTRDRVDAAAQQLGFVALADRQRAASLAGESTIEMLVEPRDVGNPYLAAFLGGAIEVASSLGIGLLTRSIESAITDTPTAWASTLARAGRLGVIEVTSTYSASRERALRAAGLSMVLVDPIDSPRTTTHSIGATNWAGAYEATKHLLGLGHRRIDYIGGPPRASCDIIRAHGWAAAMAEAGIHVDLTSVPREAFSYEHGLAAARTLLTSDNPPTAIFAGSDASAMGVLEAARQLCITVPDDLSVVGFDDTLIARISAPPLTTVHQPIADIGRTAVTTLLRLSRGENITTKRVELSTHLQVRSSTAHRAASPSERPS